MSTAPMYLTHFGLTEPPFKITPHPAFFYAGANRGATLDALLYAVTSGEGIVKVVGEVGSGKTMLCRMLIDKLGDRVDIVYLANPSYSRDEILYAIADELRLDIAGLRQGAVMRLLQENLIQRYANNRQVVVLIDEAHAMPPESLEEIRLLSNLENGHHKLLQMVLFGQPELDVTLAQVSMRQLRERIVHGFELEPLRRDDVGLYLLFRMRAAGYKGPDNFAAAAIQLLARASEGLTRRINILADKALLAAFADNAYQVEVKHVKRAVDDSQFGGRKKASGRALWIAAALTAGLLLGWLGGVLMHQRSTLPSGHAVEVPPKASVVSTVAPGSSSGITPAVTPVAQPVAAPAKPVLSPLEQHLADTERWLNESEPQQVTLQLLLSSPSVAGSTAVETFVDQAAASVAKDDLHLYRGIGRSGEYFGVLYGRFADRKAAKQALATLPAALTVNRPIFRTIGGIRQEIRPN